MNKIGIKVIILLLVLLLLACDSAKPNASAIETAIAQTQAAIPTSTPIPTPTSIPTPTPIPLSDIDLESILLLSGDLPIEFVGDQVKTIPPKVFNGAPTADQVIQQTIRSGIYGGDGISILLYQSPSDLDTAYNIVNKAMEIKGKNGIFKPLPNLGEKAVFSQSLSMFESQMIYSTQIVFTRCHALVYIDLFAPSADLVVATTYAQRLDKRLKPLVC